VRYSSKLTFYAILRLRDDRSAVHELHAPVHAGGELDVVRDGDHPLPLLSTRSLRIWNTCSLTFESNEPVGSSARMRAALSASARAPDRLVGPLVAVLGEPERVEEPRRALAHILPRQPTQGPSAG
jgi:hypothetical protein